MSRPDAATPAASSWPFTNPWPFLTAGLLAVLAALFLSRLGGGWIMAQAGLVLAGLIAAGSAVSIRLHVAGWDLDERLRSAGVLALAALTVLTAYPAIDPTWDTIRLLLAVLAGVALAGAILVLLPAALRRLVISLLVLYHFGGILMAATSVAPPSGVPWWITLQVWTRVYRPYLQFMYLNNAYHFYSPEPGPPILLWFYVEYDDGSSRWIEIPRREDFRTSLAYQRRMAMTESTNIINNQPPPNFDYLWRRRLLGRERQGRFENIRGDLPVETIWRQLAAGDVSVLIIPPYPTHVMMPHLQYRKPLPYSKQLIASYAAHVARNYRSEKDPTARVRGVKVYRVVHQILSPLDFAQGKNPFGPTTYGAFYQGEFDADGNLKDPDDPFLYWAIPILEVLKPAPPDPFFRAVVPPNPEEKIVIDYVKKHAEEFKTPELSRPQPQGQ
ncbi:MAG TPA: hypothetical protein VNK04_01070 [Gemmataceae bacterium]|nr:hypothetical protein [Gemmataceae bacterium]